MIINHNMSAINANRQMAANQSATAKSTEKLSSGLRINRAGDDAAGLAISEKMRAQIAGLDQATRNAQDGISMIQTAEGALSESHSILQRMRELAVQSSNDTNTVDDRKEIQKEIEQLTSELDRIGNDTEFNTKSLLKGSGEKNLENSGLFTKSSIELTGGTDATTKEAKQTDKVGTAFVANDTLKYTINGQELTLTFKSDATLASGTTSKVNEKSITSSSATIGINGTQAVADQAKSIADALQKVIDSNEVLKGNYTVKAVGDTFEIEAVKGGEFEGSKGSISSATKTGTGVIANVSGSTYAGAHTAAVKASAELALTASMSDSDLKDLLGKGFTINGQQVEFYNANEGAYAGSAIGINISDVFAETTAANRGAKLANTIATQIGTQVDGISVSVKAGATNTLVFTAKEGGTDGNKLSLTEGGIQKDFEVSFQVGANEGQSMSVKIEDMRADALGVSSVDISKKEGAEAAITTIDAAITKVSAQRSSLGAVQNRLEHTINNLGTSSENLTAAESRIRDVDMAEEMMEFTKNNVLSQASQAMLAQAKALPNQVLSLLQ